MGYFTTACFKAITDIGADYISRLRMDCAIFDTLSEKQINPIKLLKGKTTLKHKILIGTDRKLPVWLIAFKLPANIANKRRRTIKNHPDKRRKVTKEKLQLAGWDIYICSSDKIDIEEVRLLYKTRWQIEIIFKAWKSGLKLETNIYQHCKYRFLPEAVIWLSLLFFLLTVVPAYSIYSKQKPVSIIKLTNFILNAFKQQLWPNARKSTPLLHYYNRYEARTRKPLTKIINMLA